MDVIDLRRYGPDSGYQERGTLPRLRSRYRKGRIPIGTGVSSRPPKKGLPYSYYDDDYIESNGGDQYLFDILGARDDPDGLARLVADLTVSFRVSLSFSLSATCINCFIVRE